MQFNYGYCDQPDCAFCKEVKAANTGAVEPPLAASDLELKTTAADLQKRIDAAVSGLVHGVSAVGIVKSPKAADPDGTVYIVDAVPTKSNVFNGHANEVATKQGGNWTFQAPHDNETHLVETDNQMWTWSSSLTPPQWVKVGSVGSAQKLNDEIHGATDKAVPHDNDEFGITDFETTPVTFGLKKLSFANLKKAFWKDIQGPGDAAYDAGTGYDTIDPTDRVVVPVISPRTGAVFRVSWINFVKSMAREIFNTGAVGSGNIHDDSTFQLRAADGVVWKAPWHWIKENIWNWLKSSPAKTSVVDTDTFLTFTTGTDVMSKVSVADLKKSIGTPDYLPAIMWTDTISGTSGSGLFTIPAGVNAKHFSIDGWCVPEGAGAAIPVFYIKQSAQGEIPDMETVFTTRQEISFHPSGNAGYSGGYGSGVRELRLTHYQDANYHVHGNHSAAITVKCHILPDRWIQMSWTITYRSRNDTCIFTTGVADGRLPANAEIERIGIGYTDEVSGNWRNVMANMKCEIHT